MRSGLNAGRLLGLARRAMGLLRDTSRTGGRPTDESRSGGSRTDRRRPRSTGGRGASGPGSGRGRDERTGTTRPTGAAGPAAADSELRGTTFQYSPSIDGDADPGEVVWTWVPYEDDPSQGKDRPVVLVGRRGRTLVGVALTSKRHEYEPQLEVGTGPWDREGRPSYAKLERVLDVDPTQVRREGAVLPKARFDDLVDALRRLHGLDGRAR